MKIEEILAKKPEELSDEEKAFLAEHASELSDEDAKKFGIEKDEEFDENSLKELIDLSVEQKVQEVVKKIVATKRGEINKVSETYPASGKWSKETIEWCKALRSCDTEKLRALSTSTSDDAKAGYTVPTELYREVVRLIEEEYGVARREMRYLPFSGPGNTRDITALASSVVLHWTDEGAKKQSTQPTFGRVVQTLKKLTAIVPMTEELLEDSAINLPGLIADLVAEAIAKEEDEQFFNGTGSPWTGICNNANVTTVTMDAGKGFADISAEDLLNMQDAAPAGALKGAKYYLHRTILSYIRKLRADAVEAGDGKGPFIFQPPANGAPGTIWGYPYELVEGMPSKNDNAANKGFVIFGNLKRYAIFGDKGSMKVKILTEATITDTDGETTINLGQEDKIAYRFVVREGYVLPIPSAIVVLKTSSTIS